MSGLDRAPTDAAQLADELIAINDVEERAGYKAMLAALVDVWARIDAAGLRDAVIESVRAKGHII